MASVKISSENVPETIAHIEKTWQEFSPEFPFDFHFVDDLMERIYQNEERLAKTIGYFAGLGYLLRVWVYSDWLRSWLSREQRRSA